MTRTDDTIHGARLASHAPAGDSSPTWGRRWLQAAGVYNLVWGGLVIAAPNALFDWAGMERMQYPQIWQCVGMIVGVYGIAYLLAARDSRTLWPIVLVGLLGKILGPIGFAFALMDGVFPPRFALTILTNDLVWWIPFGMLLWDAAQTATASPTGPTPGLHDALDGLVDRDGRTLRSLTDDHPTLLVLTRHAGCTFCRETLADLSRRHAAARSRGYHVAVVTMSTPEENAALAREHRLEGAAWFSDPGRVAYRALGLSRGRFLQLFGPAVCLRGALAMLRGHGLGRLDGDGFQMAGAFVIHEGRVVRACRSRLASDRPDYGALACEIAS